MADDRLTEIRLRLLHLHRALLDAERVEHERAHGAITPAAFLQLLIGDPRFGWLSALSELIVQFDDAVLPVRTRRDPPPAPDVPALLGRARTILTGGVAGFRERYDSLAASRPALVAMTADTLTAIDEY
ncbi:MAG: hypothetical protein ACJ79K_17470 [Gemmatimonadaceae bacterium]